MENIGRKMILGITIIFGLAGTALQFLDKQSIEGIFSHIDPTKIAYLVFPIAGFVIISSVFLVFFNILKGIRSAASGIGGIAGSQFSASSKLNNVAPLLQLIQDGPSALNHMISKNAPDKEKIAREIAKIQKIKSFKKNDDNTIDILTIYYDTSEHWYKARIEGSLLDIKITSFVRFS